MRPTTRGSSTSDHGLELSAAALEEMRGKLSAVADDVVAAIVDEVPSYRDAFAGPMGETIHNAVQLALGGFLTLAVAAAPRTCAPPTPRPSRAATSSAAARPAAAAAPTRCSRRSGSAPGCRGGSCR